jgi:hypothetical protein
VSKHIFIFNLHHVEEEAGARRNMADHGGPSGSLRLCAYK